MSDSLPPLWTVTRQAPLSMGFSRQQYWSRLPCPPPGDLRNPGIEPIISGVSCIAHLFFSYPQGNTPIPINKKEMLQPKGIVSILHVCLCTNSPIPNPKSPVTFRASFPSFRKPFVYSLESFQQIQSHCGKKKELLIAENK